jgi:hypothetical protein
MEVRARNGKKIKEIITQEMEKAKKPKAIIITHTSATFNMDDIENFGGQSPEGLNRVETRLTSSMEPTIEVIEERQSPATPFPPGPENYLVRRNTSMKGTNNEADPVTSNTITLTEIKESDENLGEN